MNQEGVIRELGKDDVLTPEEIEVCGDHATELRTMPTRARKEYFRTVRMGMTKDFALVCAQAKVRAIKAGTTTRIR